jgi:hypothetical protein
MTSVWQRPQCDTSNCAEVKVENDKVYLRSSSNHQLVTFSLDEWNILKAAIKAGEFDQ